MQQRFSLLGSVASFNVHANTAVSPTALINTWADFSSGDEKCWVNKEAFAI